MSYNFKGILMVPQSLLLSLTRVPKHLNLSSYGNQYLNFYNSLYISTLT